MNPITKYRRKHNLSQPQFAALIAQHGEGASQALISQWEKRPRRIPHERCAQIERATGGEIPANSLRNDVVWRRKSGRVVSYTVEIQPTP